MSSGDARHGRRDNGLTASEYAAAGDVDPRVGEHLLDVLALEGIAAYLRPSSDLHPVTRTNLLPGRPTDRLYVDRGHLGTARDYLAKLTDGNAASATRADEVRRAESPAGDTTTEGDPGLDDAFAKIVADFDLDGPRPAWPDSEDVGDNRPRRLGPGRSRLALGGRTASSSDEEPSLLDGLVTFGADLPDIEEEDFTPPLAPPVPRPTAATILAVIGVVGGLIVFLRPSMLPTSQATGMAVGFVALLAGVAALVWKLRPGGEDDEDDPDDGAKV